MIALLSAQNVQSDRLFLCSLSPYFSEDLPGLPERWKRVIGTRRVADFKSLRFSDAVAGLRVPTTVFLGEKEAKKFPALERRCVEASRKIANATLVRIDEGPHDIGSKEYLRALKEHVN